MRRIFKVLSVVAGLGAMAVLVASFGLEYVAEAISQVSPGYLCLYLLFGCAVRLSLSLRWYLVARSFTPVPAFHRFVAARLAGDAVGALVPTGSVGGDPLRIALLYGRGVGGVSASAGVAMDRAMETAGNIICAVAYVSIFVFVRTSEATALTLPLVVLFALLASLAAPLVMLRRGRRPLSPALPDRWLRRYPLAYRFYRLVRHVENDLMVFMRERPGVLAAGVVGSLVIEALIIGEYYFLLAAFALHVGLPTVLMMLVAVGLMRVIPIPASLGALEVGQVTLMAAVEGRAELGFLAGVVMRLHETLWLAVGLATLALQGLSIARFRQEEAT